MNEISMVLIKIHFCMVQENQKKLFEIFVVWCAKCGNMHVTRTLMLRTKQNALYCNL